MVGIFISHDTLQVIFPTLNDQLWQRRFISLLGKISSIKEFFYNFYGVELKNCFEKNDG